MDSPEFARNLKPKHEYEHETICEEFNLNASITKVISL